MIERLSAAAGCNVSRETFEKLESLAALIVEANRSQNLVAATSIPDLWERHILDGAQLYGLASGGGNWCDIGSGPGLPGLVIAILGGTPITLIEPRRLRADFLRLAIDQLGLTHVTESSEASNGSLGNMTISPPARSRAWANCSRWRIIWLTTGRDGCFPRVNR